MFFIMKLKLYRQAQLSWSYLFKTLIKYILEMNGWFVIKPKGLLGTETLRLLSDSCLLMS